MANTTDDFWRMIWEYNVTMIVMLTKLSELGREKAHRYFETLISCGHYDEIPCFLAIFKVYFHKEFQHVNHVFVIILSSPEA